MEVINAQQKLATHKFYIWLISCQIPKEFWYKEEEAQFFAAREIIGDSVEKTQWDIVYPRIKNEFPAVWQKSIELSKHALGL